MILPDGTSLYHHVEIHQSQHNLPFLLMLHGFMGSENSFIHLIPSLCHFCNPVTIALTGHGKSSKSSNPINYYTEKQVSDLISIIHRLGRTNWSLYGYSMGGRLAYQLITHHPGLFQSAFIESAHCGITDTDERNRRKKSDEELACNIEANFNIFVDEWIKKPLFTQNDSKLDIEYRRQIYQQDPQSMAASLRGFGAGTMPSVCNMLHQIKLRVHLISGINDEKYLNISHQIAERYSSFTHYIVSGAGHRVHLDQPDKLISLFKLNLSLQ